MRITGSAQQRQTTSRTWFSTLDSAAAAAGSTPEEAEPSMKSAADLKEDSEGMPN